jgi:hypothetical protein
MRHAEGGVGGVGVFFFLGGGGRIMRCPHVSYLNTVI